MPDQAIIDAMIASYRELNHMIRSVSFSESAIAGASQAGESSIPGILFMMRGRELNVSQAVKSMLLGNEVAGDDEATSVMSEQQLAAGTSPNVLLSQFGTAREATLSQIRELPDEEWDRTFDTPRGQMTLRAYLQTVIDRDKQRIAQIEQVLAQKTA